MRNRVYECSVCGVTRLEAVREAGRFYCFDCYDIVQMEKVGLYDCACGARHNRKAGELGHGSEWIKLKLAVRSGRR